MADGRPKRCCEQPCSPPRTCGGADSEAAAPCCLTRDRCFFSASPGWEGEEEAGALGDLQQTATKRRGAAGAGWGGRVFAIAPGQEPALSDPRESQSQEGGLSTGAIIAIACNAVIATLILLLFLILCKACRTPSCPDRNSPSETDERGNEEKYLLQ
ncbi:hypothetical protein lerEdw1_010892 [Lerista edwardsae]|nr:hypothetical protein lerEdw1_010892 [Lerista edwardsae]